MRLICPSCGAIASLEAWQNDSDARRFMELILQFPSIVQPRLLPYFGLFRQGAKGLTWSRATRLSSELHEIVIRDTIQWDGGESRPSHPQLWAAAMDAVLARRPKSLTNHNYLRHTAWEMASTLACHAESTRASNLRQRAQSKPAEQDITPEEHATVLAQLSNFTKRFGNKA